MNQASGHNGAPRDSSADPSDWADDILSGRLPNPSRERWQPLRAGLVNVFLFEDERFPFADGRLLLRGINATGKSRVLAFLLPFLLDANLHPTRLEPDRDASRQVAWNLLMGEHRDRLGYSWIEFGRLDPERGPMFLTLGCGLKAVEDRGIVEHWFFIASCRIDRELSLVTHQRTALTRRQLVEALGERGQVFERAAEYRRSVDEKLFRLGDRYDHLMELLLSLRQPQLAKKLDLDQLESALMESLPPLSEGLLATAAESFRSLDADRRQLQASRGALAQTESFVGPHRQHVKVGLVRSAAAVRQAQRGYETAKGRLREIEQAIEGLSRQAQDHDAARRQAEMDSHTSEATLNALQQSDAARAADRLTERSQSVQSAERGVERLEQAHTAAQAHAEQQTQRATGATRKLAAIRDRAGGQSAVAEALAVPEALAREHRLRLSDLAGRQTLRVGEAVAALDAVRDEARRWRGSGQYLQAANRVIEEQRALWKERQATLERCETELQNRRSLVAESERSLSIVRGELWESMVGWITAATDLFADAAPIASIEPLWMAWADNARGSDPLAVAADEAYRHRTSDLEKRLAAVQQGRAMLAAQQRRATEELEQLQSGMELLPLRRRPRDSLSHAGRPGAPLWRLVDFAPSVPAAEHAGWEAALEASGLLDAWLYPDGRLEQIDNDTILTVDGESLPYERRLSRVLVPDQGRVQDDIPRETLLAVLERVGVGESAGRLWIDRSGRWQNGPLFGHGSKEDAEFVGPAARERHRQRRTSALVAELAACDQEEAQLQSTADEIVVGRARLEGERESLPSSEPLRRCLTELETRERYAAEAQVSCSDAARRERPERERLNELIETRNRDAQDMGLAAWAQRPDEFVDRIDRYLQASQLLERDLSDLESTLDEESHALTAQARANEALAIAVRSLSAAKEELRQQQVELETLKGALGAEAAEITSQIEAARQALRTSKGLYEQYVCLAAEANARLAAERERIADCQAEIERHDQRRREAVEWLKERAARGLLEVAAFELESPALPWTLTQGVDLARLVYRAGEHMPHDDDAWQRSQVRMHEQRETLRSYLSSYDLSPEPDYLTDGLQLVYVSFRGAVLRIDQLARQLEEEIGAHERVLSEKERQIFEDFMLGEVGWEVHRRMHEAAEQVERMNAEVASRPMSTGMQMRFRWELADEASPEMRAARDVLARTLQTWSAAERAALVDFLQKRIQNEQSRDPSNTWREHLEAALDYRRWHALRIERRAGPDQPWRQLTRRTYGALSGGEKAIALTIPQCAAASAYYGSADRLAPRFILLDEAFAGVSTDNRSSCLELLVSFDLDVVMTSENERGCYPSVPALAICRLSRAADLAVVLNDVFIWNGKRERGPADLPLSNERLPLFDSVAPAADAPTASDLDGE